MPPPVDRIYQEIAAERLFFPDPPRGVEDEQPLPAVLPPRREPTQVADHLAAPTWNGLRPEDRAYPQPPPQDPEWRPDADG